MKKLLVSIFYRAELPMEYFSLASPFSKIVKNKRAFSTKLLMDCSHLNSSFNKHKEKNYTLSLSIDIAENYIKTTDKAWINFYSLHHKNYDELRLLYCIKKQFTRSRIKRLLTKKVQCYLSCYFHEKTSIAAQPADKSLYQKTNVSLLTSVLKQRRLYINQLYNEINALLMFDGHHTQPELCSLLVSVIDKAANEYLRYTFFHLSNNYNAYIDHLLSLINADLTSHSYAGLSSEKVYEALSYLENSFKQVLKEHQQAHINDC